MSPTASTDQRRADQAAPDGRSWPPAPLRRPSSCDDRARHPIMRRATNGANRRAPLSADLAAMSVRTISWLMARPNGETFEELLERFRLSRSQLHDVLDHLAHHRQVKRHGERYLATPERTWRPAT